MACNKTENVRHNSIRSMASRMGIKNNTFAVYYARMKHEFVSTRLDKFIQDYKVWNNLNESDRQDVFKQVYMLATELYDSVNARLHYFQPIRMLHALNELRSIENEDTTRTVLETKYLINFDAFWTPGLKKRLITRIFHIFPLLGCPVLAPN